MTQLFSRGCNSSFKLVRIISKITFPILYRLLYKTHVNLSDQSDIIVSLTTFPKRVKYIDLVIKSILNQSHPIKEIQLYVSELDDFTHLQKQKLSSLKNVRIKWVKENIKSHKKYFYAFQQYGEHFHIVTVDDDIIYDHRLVEFLYSRYLEKNSIICTIARDIKIINGRFLAYKNWNNTDRKNPPKNILPIGAGGVFYPKGYFHKLKITIEGIKKYCLNADDLLLYFLSNKFGLEKVIISNILYPIPLPYNVKESLYQLNVVEEGNDMQLSQILSFIRKDNF